MLRQRTLNEVFSQRTIFLLALISISSLVPSQCASLRNREKEHVVALDRGLGHLSSHAEKEEGKRSKAFGDAVRFLTDMDRSYLGHVRPRFGKRSQFTFPLGDEAEMTRENDPRFRNPFSLENMMRVKAEERGQLDMSKEEKELVD